MLINSLTHANEQGGLSRRPPTDEQAGSQPDDFSSLLAAMAAGFTAPAQPTEIQLVFEAGGGGATDLPTFTVVGQSDQHSFAAAEPLFTLTQGGSEPFSISAEGLATPPEALATTPEAAAANAGFVLPSVDQPAEFRRHFQHAAAAGGQPPAGIFSAIEDVQVESGAPADRVEGSQLLPAEGSFSPLDFFPPSESNTTGSERQGASHERLSLSNLLEEASEKSAGAKPENTNVAEASAAGAALNADGRQPGLETTATGDSERTVPFSRESLGSLIDTMRDLLRRSTATRTIKLRLHPEELGDVQLSLSRDESGRLSAHFAAPREEARAALSGGLDHLRAALEQAGIQLASLEVGAGTTSAGHTPGGGDQSAADASHATQQRTTSRTAAHEAAATPARAERVDRLLTLRA
ncbi:MAG: flagellar hook-length control protein FliK [Pyrinomonadaceae bacterium]